MSKQTSSLAYMDDTVWIANTKEHMQQMTKVAESFFELNLITINTSKSDLIVLNSIHDREANTIDFVNSTLVPHEPEIAIRYLGIWISEDGKKKVQIEKLTDNIIKMTNILRGKRLTDKQLRYIINHVIFPQTEYLLTDMVLPEQTIDKVNSKIKQCFKSSMGFQSSLPDSILHSHWGYRIFNIEDRQLQLHATELMNRLNMNNECGTITKIRLQNLQNQIWSSEPLWQLTAESWKGITNLGLDGQIIALLAKNEINYNITTQNLFPICPTGGGISVEKFMNSQNWYKKNRKACCKHKVLFIEQMINANMTKTLEWLNIDQEKPTSTIPNWFKELKEEINNRWEEITRSSDLNPYNRIQQVAPEIVKKQLMVTVDSDTQILMGRVYKNPSETNTSVLIRHYVLDPMDNIRGSPIAPCG